MFLGEWRDCTLQDQGEITGQLSDKVKQVRDYRNWIAHGKRQPRDPRIVNLTPKNAFDRLKEFLVLLGITVESELKDPKLVERERLDY